MSRPPKPVRWSKRPIGGHPSVSQELRRLYASAEAVHAREALGEQAHQERAGKPDHVQVVAFDALDERGADALDRVRAGSALPLPCPYVRRDIARVERTEPDRSDLV